MTVLRQAAPQYYVMGNATYQCGANGYIRVNQACRLMIFDDLMTFRTEGHTILGLAHVDLVD